ncbi:MAG: hypothetical protein MK132_03040 [Lentisphaerales bacterium]|nr:hypothetical protein [Lentisphaerales bacterium]
MSSFVFRIACPRCETAVDIHIGKHEYSCSRCEFIIKINDAQNMLAKFKSGEVEDLDFSEAPIKGSSALMDAGLQLTFSKLSSGSSVSPADKVEAPKAAVDEDEFGNKTANTQVIQLTFDPAKFLEEMQDGSKGSKSDKKKISLKKVIKYGEMAKPPVASPKEKLIRNITIAALIILFIGMIIAITKGN